MEKTCKNMVFLSEQEVLDLLFDFGIIRFQEIEDDKKQL